MLRFSWLPMGEGLEWLTAGAGCILVGGVGAAGGGGGAKELLGEGLGALNAAGEEFDTRWTPDEGVAALVVKDTGCAGMKLALGAVGGAEGLING